MGKKLGKSIGNLQQMSELGKMGATSSKIEGNCSKTQ
jgi:hypothetical protein